VLSLYTTLIGFKRLWECVSEGAPKWAKNGPGEACNVSLYIVRSTVVTICPRLALPLSNRLKVVALFFRPPYAHPMLPPLGMNMPHIIHPPPPAPLTYTSPLRLCCTSPLGYISYASKASAVPSPRAMLAKSAAMASKRPRTMAGCLTAHRKNMAQSSPLNKPACIPTVGAGGHSGHGLWAMRQVIQANVNGTC
jgi:hypothetical protein